MEKAHRNWIFAILGIATVLIIFLVIFNSGNKVVCNYPYIQVEDGCCLDENSNNICDTDEQQRSHQSNQESQQTTSTYCGDGTCQSDESCSSCSSDCRECNEGGILNEISFSEVNNQIETSGFEYTPITCNGGTCRKMNDPNYAAISRFSNSNDISKQFAFKIDYSPSGKDLYFQAYTSDTLNDFTTSNVIKLSPGENLIAMGKADSKLNNDLNLNLCFSYKDFSISNDDGIPSFLDWEYAGGGLKELDSSEYACINKVFNAPKISVSLNPSELSFSFNQGDGIAKGEEITVTNTGDSPVMFRFFVPSSSDGTERGAEEPNFYISESSDYTFVLQSGESHTSSIVINLKSTDPAYYSDTAYVYALSDCSALYLATCQENALYKKSFEIKTTVS